METDTLKDWARIIVETDEETPITIAEISAENIAPADGYRVRLTPDYKQTDYKEVDKVPLVRQKQSLHEVCLIQGDLFIDGKRIRHVISSRLELQNDDFTFLTLKIPVELT